jgi:hypothetical protein
MNITDEKLSAFLDAELSTNDMEAIREALEVDDDLVMRLAELSQVDQWVVENAQQIDLMPVPMRLTRLAQQIDKGQSLNNVVQLSNWKLTKIKINTPMSLAASVVLAVTVGIATMTYQGEHTISNEIVSILDSSISGETSFAADNTRVKAQLSFANQDGNLCRQYLLIKDQTNSTNIACKENKNWHLHAYIQTNNLNTQSYQTANRDQNLEQVIDGMIAGAPLNREQEQSAILKQWQLNN